MVLMEDEDVLPPSPGLVRSRCMAFRKPAARLWTRVGSTIGHDPIDARKAARAQQGLEAAKAITFKSIFSSTSIEPFSIRHCRIMCEDMHDSSAIDLSTLIMRLLVSGSRSP